MKEIPDHGTRRLSLDSRASELSCSVEQKCDKPVIKFFKENVLIIMIVVSVILGVTMGIALRTVWSHEDLRKIWYLEFPGRILLNMLKLIMLPLIISSLVYGMADIERSTSGKLGRGAFAYYLVTTFLAVVTGIVLVSLLKPGRSDEFSTVEPSNNTLSANHLDALLDLVSQCFPDNIITASFERKVTGIGSEKFEHFNKTSNKNYTVEVDKPYLKTRSGPNILGLVVVSVTVGTVTSSMGDNGNPLKYFFKAVNDLIFIVVDVIIMYTPIGLMFLVAGKFVATKDMTSVWTSLGMYMGTVMMGLTIHGCIVLPSMYFIFTKKNPVTFALNQMKSILTAWGTASSSATLPITMNCLIEKNKINVNIVRFMAPVGATINMDGTALYEAVSSIFIAQINDIDMSIADVIIISLTATAAAIGAAGIPQAGLVTMVIVLTSVGLPTKDVALILTVDWFLDRFRTSLNVWGDAIGAGILHHHLHELFEEEEEDVKEENKDDNKDVQDPYKDEYSANMENKSLELELSRKSDD